ncbi:GntR family transcriptional regulator [Paenarthrobacter nicotinovorans]|uniref:GntR family transcriptional regulator n=1 Tax=Paenarthrobacter nicotinovorans TaxID=29320 RepID=A0ABV0GM08_PAENI
MCSSSAVAPKIERRLLRHLAFDSLLGMIVRGEIEPGARIHDQDMVEQLGISRTPIREALTSLALYGLVVVDPNRTTIVTPLCRRGVLDDLQVLSALYPLAVSELLSGAGTETLQQADATMNELIDTGTGKLDLLAYVADFLHKQTRNAALAETIREMELRLLRYLFHYPELLKQDCVVTQLSHLMGLLSRRDGESVAQVASAVGNLQGVIAHQTDELHTSFSYPPVSTAPGLMSALIVDRDAAK